VRLNDAVIGLILFALSLAVLWHVRGFPTIPGQPYGAGLYPRVIGIGLAVVSVLLMISGWRSGGPMMRLGRAADGRPLAFVTTILALFFYLLFADRLGFILASIAMLCALLWAYGVPRLRIVPVAVIATLVIHAGFYKLLKVPLPWGLLQPIAW